MKIPTNKISSVIKFFKEELKEIYPETEIQSFIYLAFEHYLGFSKHDLVLKANNHISESELLHFNFVVKDLKKHKPIQYILGEMEFYGLKFKVNQHVLIPRPETEELVDWIIKNGTKDGSINLKQALERKTSERINILDIGTGSGCIAIALKKNLPNATVTAMDISDNALLVSKENAVNNNVDVHFIHHDILGKNGKLPEEGKKNTTAYLDIIVSNPPYICTSEKGLMEKNVLDYEPHSALFVDDNDFLLFFNTIADFALMKLKPGGELYFEINESYGIQILKMLEKKGFENCILKKDLRGKDRMIRCELLMVTNNE